MRLLVTSAEINCRCWRDGITLPQAACLARCNGARVSLHHYGTFSLEDLRREVRMSSRCFTMMMPNFISMAVQNCPNDCQESSHACNARIP